MFKLEEKVGSVIVCDNLTQELPDRRDWVMAQNEREFGSGFSWIFEYGNPNDNETEDDDEDDEDDEDVNDEDAETDEERAWYNR
jgi:hypothetical protein